MQSVHLCSSSSAVLEALEERQARACWCAFRELRPHLADADEFIERWHLQRREGYRMAYIECTHGVVAGAGLRVMHTLAWGRVIYLDDLITLASHRGQGLGTRLLDWAHRQAIAHGCAGVHLDSGYHRHAAHALYLRNGFKLLCHHFERSNPAVTSSNA